MIVQETESTINIVASEEQYYMERNVHKIHEETIHRNVETIRTGSIKQNSQFVSALQSQREASMHEKETITSKQN